MSSRSATSSRAAACRRRWPRPSSPRPTLEAGEAAGGEHGDVTSACLLVVDRECFPYVDLRVDKDAAPLLALRRLWAEYAPLADGFVRRAVDPDDAPII